MIGIDPERRRASGRGRRRYWRRRAGGRRRRWRAPRPARAPRPTPPGGDDEVGRRLGRLGRGRLDEDREGSPRSGQPECGPDRPRHRPTARCRSSRSRSRRRCRSSGNVDQARTRRRPASSASGGTRQASATNDGWTTAGAPPMPGAAVARRPPSKPISTTSIRRSSESARAAARAGRSPAAASSGGRPEILEQLPQRRPDGTAAGCRRCRAPARPGVCSPAASNRSSRSAMAPARTIVSSGRRAAAAATSAASSSSERRSSAPGGSPAPTRTASTPWIEQRRVIASGSMRLGARWRGAPAAPTGGVVERGERPFRAATTASRCAAGAPGIEPRQARHRVLESLPIRRASAGSAAVRPLGTSDTIASGSIAGRHRQAADQAPAAPDAPISAADDVAVPQVESEEGLRLAGHPSQCYPRSSARRSAQVELRSPLRRPRSISSSISSSRAISCSMPASSARISLAAREVAAEQPAQHRVEEQHRVGAQRPIRPARLEEVDGRDRSGRAAGSRGRPARRARRAAPRSARTGGSRDALRGRARTSRTGDVGPSARPARLPRSRPRTPGRRRRRAARRSRARSRRLRQLVADGLDGHAGGLVEREAADAGPEGREGDARWRRSRGRGPSRCERRRR